MATMSPEEVLQYGKRVVLFQKGKGRHKEEFVIEDNRIFQQGFLIMGDRKHIMKTNPVEIMDIYDQIEHVYSQKKKGVMIARRSGNYKSNQQRLLPLRKTGKGMGELIQSKELAVEAYKLMDFIENREEIKRQAQTRITQRINVKKQQSIERMKAK